MNKKTGKVKSGKRQLLHLGAAKYADGKQHNVNKIKKRQLPRM